MQSDCMIENAGCSNSTLTLNWACRWYYLRFCCIKSVWFLDLFSFFLVKKSGNQKWCDCHYLSVYAVIVWDNERQKTVCASLFSTCRMRLNWCKWKPCVTYIATHQLPPFHRLTSLLLGRMQLVIILCHSTGSWQWWCNGYYEIQ